MSYGQLASQFLDAFNSGEAAMRTFLEKSPTATPIDERIVHYRRMKNDLGSLTPVRFVSDDRLPARVIVVIVRNAAHEEISLTLMCAPDKAQITGIRLERRPRSGAQQAAGPTGAEEEISVPRAAELLGVCVDTVRSLIRVRELHAEKRGIRGSYRISVESWNDFVIRHGLVE